MSIELDNLVQDNFPTAGALVLIRPLRLPNFNANSHRSKDGYVIKPSSHIEISEDKDAEKYQLTVKKVGMDDAGVYTLTAKNEIGETAQQAKLIIRSESMFLSTIFLSKIVASNNWVYF